ncbi:hypothetical protein AKJ65_02625 [candidate division MSBL1 archaeon SCGC-AAA259E19]|uniref:Uncharacterized protein n=1 Tax=candidate division MSBL1 archaeon SCGC-AAA259E19 TaxID=1698264 RepID=A0A133ULI0_9EURY|nr:hypothetical protein AKJ65_02625 [candidate division MSBL1 archaeon SCGC-AAA259E19]
MDFLISLAMIPIGFLCGILLLGLHRKIIARIQGRPGPPIQQELYHNLKFFVKEVTVPRTASLPITLGITVLIIGIWNIAILTIFMGLSLYIIFSILVTQKIVEHGGGLATGSPYGKFGGVRSVFTTMTELPLFGIAIALIYLETGSSLMISDLWSYQATHGSLITHVPLAFLAIFIVVLSKMKYSPFAIIYGKDIVTGYQTVHYGSLRSCLLTGESLMVFSWISVLVTVFLAGLPIWGMILAGIGILILISFIAALTPLLAPHHSIQFQASIVMGILGIRLVLELVI